MAVGDAYQTGPTSIANGAWLDFQPAAGTEVVVHNVACGGAAQLERYDGTNFIAVATLQTGGGWLNQALHCTNTKWWRVKNTSGSSAYFSGDGFVTK